MVYNKRQEKKMGNCFAIDKDQETHQIHDREIHNQCVKWNIQKGHLGQSDDAMYTAYVCKNSENIPVAKKLCIMTRSAAEADD